MKTFEDTLKNANANVETEFFKLEKMTEILQKNPEISGQDFLSNFPIDAFGFAHSNLKMAFKNVPEKDFVEISQVSFLRLKPYAILDNLLYH